MKKIIIIGGVAAGMSAAAKARRLDKEAKITVYEKTEFVSWGACGMPYYVGGFFDDSNVMIARTAEATIKSGIDLKVKNEVIKIDSKNKKVLVRDLETNKKFEDKYDKLLITTGAKAIIPNIENINIGNVSTLKDFKDALIKRATIESVIESIKKVDFSAFYREVLYKNSQLNITKELVMKEVLPNIILMPTFGSRAIMWEELSSRQKDSTGRFLFPIFTSEDLESLAIPTIGAFRWELCKTMLGPAWNDITQMSLTSSYSDYIQFYKKNRDLSDDSKEKIKIQIKKCRNNLREVFVSDYFIWIKY